MLMLKSTHEKIVKNHESKVKHLEILMYDACCLLVESGYRDKSVQNSKGQWRDPVTGQIEEDPE